MAYYWPCSVGFRFVLVQDAICYMFTRRFIIASDSAFSICYSLLLYCFYLLLLFKQTIFRAGLKETSYSLIFLIGRHTK